MMMNKVMLHSCFLILASCHAPSSVDDNYNDEVISTIVTSSSSDTFPKVTGIGGIFFITDDTEKTKKWYADNLGIQTNDWGASFEFRNTNRPQEINYLQWSPFQKGSDYMSPSKKEFMVNYRVQNIDGLLNKLRSNGVTILDTIQTFDYGKFVHIMDDEGNKIELWEPIDSVLTSYGGNTTK